MPDSFTLRTKLLIIGAVPMLLLGSIAALAALQAKSLGDNAAEQVESVDQALAIERLADALRAELASTLDPGGTPESLEEARSATNTRWVKVFAFMNEADRATLDLNQDELLRIRKEFGDDPAASHELLSSEILAQAPEGPVALLGAQGFDSLIAKTVRLDRFQADAYPDVETALDISALKNLALWQEALVAEKHAFELFLQPDIPDEVERLGLLGPSAAATEAQDQFVNLTPAGRRAIADRLAGNSAALVLDRARGITRTDSVEARGSLQMSAVTAAADDLSAAIAAERRILEVGIVEATNNHLTDARAQQRMVLLGGAGSLLVIATITLLLSRSIIREVKWLELRTREPHPRMFPSATSHGAMPVESSELDIESRSMPPAQALPVGPALAGAADRIDQTSDDKAIVSAELSALDSIPASLRAPVLREQIIDEMPILPIAVPASSEVGSFDPAVAPSVPDDLAVPYDPAESDELAESDGLAESEDLHEPDDLAMSDAFSVPERLRRQMAGSSLAHEIEPPLPRVSADQFAAEFAAASLSAPELPATVAFVGALPHRHTPLEEGVVLPEAEAPVELPAPLPEKAEVEAEAPVELPAPLQEMAEVGPEAEVEAPVEMPSSSDGGVEVEVEAPVELPSSSDGGVEVEVEAPVELPSSSDGGVEVEAEAPLELPHPLPEKAEVGPEAEVEAPVELPSSSDEGVEVEVEAPVVLPSSSDESVEVEVEVEAPVELPTPPSRDDQEVSGDEMNQAPATEETFASAILTIGAAFAAYERRSKPYDQEAFLDEDQFEHLANLGR